MQEIVGQHAASHRFAARLSPLIGRRRRSSLRRAGLSLLQAAGSPRLGAVGSCAAGPSELGAVGGIAVAEDADIYVCDRTSTSLALLALTG